MFPFLSGTVDQTLQRRREARLSRMLANRARVAQLDQEFSEDVRAADDDGDWRAAGCSSNAQWVAQFSHSDYRTAERITSTSLALRELPAIDEKFRAGEITLDQTTAAVTNATPETDAEIARLSVGKAPGQIALEVRTLNPPKVADDREIYRRRKLSMAWTNGNRELIIHGRLPLEQGLAFEHAVRDAAKAQRALDKKDGVVLEWQQSAADALVTLTRNSGGSKRTPAMLIVHVGEDGPAVLEGAGPISDETAERLTCGKPRLFIERHGDDIVCSREGRNASFPQKRAMHRRSPHCQYPGCSSTRDLDAHHMTPWALGGKTRVGRMILLCGRHHDRMHEYGIRTSGTGDSPIFTGPDGRLITANQPHAPPA